MKIIVNDPPVYCVSHGAFLEECWLEDNLISSAKCDWYYDEE